MRVCLLTWAFDVSVVAAKSLKSLSRHNFAIGRILPNGLKTCLRPGVHLAREAGVCSRLLVQKAGQGPCVVFLPAYGRQGAALLRMYNMARALRRLGWRTVVMPWRLTLAQRHRLLARARPDIVMMQGARHALNRPALYPGYPVFYDMDDADFHLDHLQAPVRDAMADVAGVIAGSRYVADWCRAAGAAQADVVWTGAPLSRRVWQPQTRRRAVIAWAQTRPMTYRREAELVRATVARIGGQHPVTLRLYDRQEGDDPGYAKSFDAPGVTVEWHKTCRYRDYLASFDDVALGLAPFCPQSPFSRGKSFGKVLAYLEARVPVIGSDACEHGAFFDDTTGVITNDPAQWVQAAVHLLQNASARQSMGDAAHAQFRRKLTVSASAARLDGIFRAHLGLK